LYRKAVQIEEAMRRIKGKSWTVEEKTRIVLSLLGGTPASELSRNHGASQTTIGKWKDKFLVGGQAGLASSKPGVDPRDLEIEQLKLALADAVMTNEVLKNPPWSHATTPKDETIRAGWKSSAVALVLRA
jgi:transposase-like protein